MKGLCNGEPGFMGTMGHQHHIENQHLKEELLSCQLCENHCPQIPFQLSNQSPAPTCWYVLDWKESIFVSKWDWIRKSRCMRHSIVPFSTLWLFISFSILIINWANLQSVFFFSSSLLYLHTTHCFCANHKRIALLLLCPVPYSFQWCRVLYMSIVPELLEDTSLCSSLRFVALPPEL